MRKTRVATVTQQKDSKGRDCYVGAWGAVLLVINPTDPDKDGNERWNVHLRQRWHPNDERMEAERERMDADREANREGHRRRMAREGVVELGGRD